jgi:hypothetical protein
MNLKWIFGSSMQAHHLLWAYLAVWIIQGGYAAWIAYQWTHTFDGEGLDSMLETDSDLESDSDEDS